MPRCARPLIVGVKRLRHLVQPQHGARVLHVAGLRVDLAYALERRGDAVLAVEVLLDGTFVLLLRPGCVCRAHLLALHLRVLRLEVSEPHMAPLGARRSDKTLLCICQGDRACAVTALLVVQLPRLEHEHDLLAQLSISSRVFAAC